MRAYTLEMRAYDDTMVGYLSGNSTSFSGSAGISRGLVYSPNINTVRGYVSDTDINASSAVNVLSVAELLTPFTAAQADPPRSAMQVSQAKHSMPVEVSNKQLFGSGINKTIAYMLSDDFCFKAKDSGVVEEIDEENKVVILKYDNGTYDAIDMQETLVKNSNSGFFIKQKFLIAYKAGERFKKRDVIAYNPSFFTGKGSDIDYCPGTLCKVAISAGDFAYEDATMISNKMAEKCTSKVTICKSAALKPTTTIKKMVNVGDEVIANDHLLDFVEEFEDDATNELISGLEDLLNDEDMELISQNAIKTKYTGKVVDIKVYYNRPFEELNPTLQKLIINYNNKNQKRKDKLISKNIKTSSVKIPPMNQQTNTKINGAEYDGVLIEFYIEYFDKLGVGDKISFSTAIKGIISKVMPDEESPMSELHKDEVIEAICTPAGIISRMTLDIYSLLYVNKVLVELGRKIKDIWEK